MIIIMKPGASKDAVQHVKELIESKALTAHLSEGSQVTIVGVVGDKTGDPLSELMQADLAAVSALARQIAALIKDALSPARSFSAASDF